MARKIPKKLLDELHEANERFGEARRKREEAIDEPVMESTHLDQAKEQLHDAEKSLDEVDERIETALHPNDIRRRTIPSNAEDPLPNPPPLSTTGEGEKP